MIHFDIPWSIMLLQQRNGRIDRYGQKRKPQITYLLTQCKSEKFKGDLRILEILVDKENQAHDNIGDPARLMGLFEAWKEVLTVKDAVEGKKEIKSIFKDLGEDSGPDSDANSDNLDFLLNWLTPDEAPEECRTRSLPSLYPSEYHYLKAALSQVRETKQFKEFKLVTWDHDERLQLHAPEALRELTRLLPTEARPKDDLFDLVARPDAMMQSIQDSLTTENTWPALQYLWPLHPLVGWATDRIRTTFERMEAPVLVLPSLNPGELSYIINAHYSNRKGYTVYGRWFTVRVKDGKYQEVIPFEESREFAELQTKTLPNSGSNNLNIQEGHALLSEAIDQVTDLSNNIVGKHWREEVEPVVQGHLHKLGELQKRHIEALDKRYAKRFAENAEKDLGIGLRRAWEVKKAKELKKVKADFKNYAAWIQSTLHIEISPSLQVIAVLAGRR